MTDPSDTLALDPKLRALLAETSSATVSIQLLKRGFRFAAIAGVRPLNPKACRFVGPANDETRAAYQRWVAASRPDEV